MDKEQKKLEIDYKKIIDALKRVGNGDLTTEMTVSTSDSNISEIASSFNEMIHKLKEMVDELRNSNRQLEIGFKRLKKIFDGSKDIILQINKYGTIVDINESVKEILGYEPDELRGRHFAKSGVILEDEIPQLIKMFNIAIKKSVSKDIMSLGFKTKEGEKLYMDANIKLLKTEDEIEGAVIVLHNVSEYIEINKKLKDEKEKLRSIISSIDDVVIILDRDLRLIEYYIPPDYKEHFLFTELKDYTGKAIKNFFPKTVSNEIERMIRYSMKTKEMQMIDFPIKVSKEVLYFDVKVSALKGLDGDDDGIAILMRDITEHVKMEEELARSEKKYHEIFEQTPQGLIILDPEGRIVDVNKKVCEWLGYKPVEMIGKDHLMYPFLSKSGKIMAMRKFVQRLSGKFVPPYELEFIARDGSSYTGKVEARPIKNEKGEIELIVVMVTAMNR